MHAVNAVLMFIPVWTFTAVCHADRDFNVSCENVTGFVGKEANLTCNVTLMKNDCCIKNYKFQYTERDNYSDFCRKELALGSCDQRSSFTCNYTPTALTQQLKAFLQTSCGRIKTDFTVSIAGKIEDKPEDGSKNPGPNNPVIPTAVGLSVIIIFIIILMAIIYKKQSRGFKNVRLLCFKHENDSNHPDDVI